MGRTKGGKQPIPKTTAQNELRQLPWCVPDLPSVFQIALPASCSDWKIKSYSVISRWVKAACYILRFMESGLVCGLRREQRKAGWSWTMSTQSPMLDQNSSFPTLSFGAQRSTPTPTSQSLNGHQSSHAISLNLGHLKPSLCCSKEQHPEVLLDKGLLWLASHGPLWTPTPAHRLDKVHRSNMKLLW